MRTKLLLILIVFTVLTQLCTVSTFAVTNGEKNTGSILQVQCTAWNAPPEGRGSAPQQLLTTNNRTINRALNGGQVSGKDMVGALRKEGFTVSRQTGSHVQLKGPNGQNVTVPLHGNKDLSIGTLRSVLKQAGYM